MKKRTQASAAKSVGRTLYHFNGIIRGRRDAGKKLAAELAGRFGGTVEIWMFEDGRKYREALFNRYQEG